MVLKKARQDKILELIRRAEIQTQEEMLLRLKECGYEATQATVSRDIRELNLVKSISPRGVYCYATPPKKEGVTARLGNVVTDSVTTVDAAGNMVVVKTYPGLASAVAAYIDSQNLPELLGTIAGDDAVFVVVRDASRAQAFCEKIQGMLRKSEK